MRQLISKKQLTSAWRRGAWLLAAILSCVFVVSAQNPLHLETAQAIELYKNGKYESVADILSKVVANSNNKLEAEDKLTALFYLAKAQMNLARYREAENSLRLYTAQRPTSSDALYLLGTALFRLGRARESLEAYARAAAFAAPQADDLKIIGLNYGLLGDFARAAGYLESAVKLAPDNLEARYYLGRVHFEQNKFEESIKDFEEVLRRDSHHVKAQNNLGQAFEAVNNVDAAIAAYRTAIELDRTSLSSRRSELPMLNLATLLLQRSNLDEALALLLQAKEANPRSAKVRFQLGKAYLQLNRKSDAEQELVEATRLDPQDVSGHYQLGQLYHRLGKKELARRELQISEQLRAKAQP